MLVYTYTANTGADMQRLIALGVDGIETDVPEFLVHILHAHRDAR
jgi:glycerophosphoryl diester phosphodiesterase